MKPEDDIQECVVASLVAATRAGLPSDVQGLLMHGDPTRGVAPGIMKAMVIATIDEHDDNRDR